MAITFPSSPTVGDIFTSNGRSWQWDGTAWTGYGNLPDPSVFAVDATNDAVSIYGDLSVGASAQITGDLSVDTDTFHVDATNNRVGIGTATPSSELDIVGNINATASSGATAARLDLNTGDAKVYLEANSGDGNSAVLYALDATTENTIPLTLQGSNVNLGSFSGTIFARGDLSVYNDLDVTNEGTGTTLYADSTNNRVGIGTTIPSTALDVEDATTAVISLNDSGGTVGGATNSHLIFEAGGSIAGRIGFVGTSVGNMAVANEDGTLGLTTKLGHSVFIRTNDTTRMTVDATGKVGIGTTTPDTVLHVAQDNPTLTLEATAASGNMPLINMIGTRGTGTASRVELNSRSTGSLEISVDPDDSDADTDSYFAVSIDGSEYFRVDANSRTSISNIGGTTADASENLNVFGTSLPSAKIVTTDDSGASAYLTIGGARTTSSTSYLGRINFDNLANQSTSENYTAAQIQAFNFPGDHTLQDGSMELRVSDSGTMETRMLLDPARVFIYGQEIDVPLRVSSTDATCTMDFTDANTTGDYKVRVGANGDDFVVFAGGDVSLRIHSAEKYLELSNRALGIVLPNTETTNYGTPVDGLVVFDLNFYNDSGYGTGTYQPSSAWTSDGGGLLIKDQEGWGGIVSSTNMRWLNADFASLDSGSKAFKITHPVLGGDHKLRHSSVESPYIDNIYRGMAILDENGSATVDLDAHFGMTAGTWVALNTNPWVMAQVKGGGAVDWDLEGSTLTLTGDPGAEARWLVMAERQDEAVMNTDRTDENGRLIVEFEQVTTTVSEEIV